MAGKEKSAGQFASTIPAYEKEQILASKQYGARRDVLSVILKEGQVYTLEQVDEELMQFQKRKVV